MRASGAVFRATSMTRLSFEVAPRRRSVLFSPPPRNSLHLSPPSHRLKDASNTAISPATVADCGHARHRRVVSSRARVAARSNPEQASHGNERLLQPDRQRWPVAHCTPNCCPLVACQATTDKRQTPPSRDLLSRRTHQAALDTYPAGLGEPINGVLSADSDAEVLTSTGFQDWAVSIGYAGQCLGQSAGNPQAANLGDGHGFRTSPSFLSHALCL